MKKILVTGANGQLGRCLKDLTSDYPDYTFVFVSRELFDITKYDMVRGFFRKNSFDYCINTAAYTNVEKAESERDAAFAVNAEAVKNLSEVCRENDITLIHISTDYVFDGEKNSPYVETDDTNPLNVYGASKLKGEQYVKKICSKYYIIRTSWLYSQYGHNFLNTIIKYAQAGKNLTITTQQSGTPTNANDLAKFILKIIINDTECYGLFHISNAGVSTWYDFAETILENVNQNKPVNLAKTDHYVTFAKRPVYSVLDNSKFYEAFDAQAIDWKTSLASLLNKNVTI
tara:strand:+ start:839 stop:1699 length:861 start_codon:yes stop_codon:yes gene_type:complete